MKRVFILMIICTLAANLFSQVSNIRAVQENTNSITILYDLIQTRDIELLVSLDDGITYLPPLQKISGNVGKDVAAGKDLKITWNHLEEVGYIDDKQVKFKIKATINKALIIKEMGFSFANNVTQKEVTVAQYAAFVYATGYRTTAEKLGHDYILKNKRVIETEGVNWRHDAYGILRPENHYQESAVLHLSRHDIISFCNWCGYFAPREILDKYHASDTLSLDYSKEMKGFALYQTEPKEPFAIKEKKAKKEKIPRTYKYDYQNEMFAKADFSYSFSPQCAFGVTYGQVKKWGWYVDLMSNFNFKGIATKTICNNAGIVGEGDFAYIPYYSEKVSKFRFSLMGGALYKVHPSTAFYLGAGYGYRAVLWETTDKEWIRNSERTFNGINFEAGMYFNVRHFIITGGVSTVNFKLLEMKIGLGWAF